MTTAHRNDFETSANDVHAWRAQDIAVSEFAGMLSDMQKAPWKTQSLKATFDACGTYLNHDMPALVLHARLLSMISNPIASLGEYRHSSKPGSTYYVTAGNTRIECTSRARSTALQEKLNTEAFARLAPHRKERMREIKELALGRSSWAIVLDETYHNAQVVVFASAQLCVLTSGPAEATELASMLNSDFTAAISDDITAATAGLLQALGSDHT